MDREETSGGRCYYGVLGTHKNASVAEIRSAYRKLAMKWHPDRCTRNPSLAGEAKRRFQQIQEAYTVLSDEGKRAMYDAGLYDPFEEEEEGFSDFMQEMLSMMDNVRAEEKSSFEDLQKLFVDMAGEQGVKLRENWFPEFDAGASSFDGCEASRRARLRGSEGSSGGVKKNWSRLNVSNLGGFGSFMTFVI